MKQSLSLLSALVMLLVAGTADVPAYDLTGRPMPQLSAGRLFIKGGKKFLRQ